MCSSQRLICALLVLSALLVVSQGKPHKRFISLEPLDALPDAEVLAADAVSKGLEIEEDSIQVLGAQSDAKKVEEPNMQDDVKIEEKDAAETGVDKGAKEDMKAVAVVHKETVVADKTEESEGSGAGADAVAVNAAKSSAEKHSSESEEDSGDVSGDIKSEAESIAPSAAESDAKSAIDESDAAVEVKDVEGDAKANETQEVADAASSELEADEALGAEKKL